MIYHRTPRDRGRSQAQVQPVEPTSVDLRWIYLSLGQSGHESQPVLRATLCCREIPVLMTHIQQLEENRAPLAGTVL